MGLDTIIMSKDKLEDKMNEILNQGDSHEDEEPISEKKFGDMSDIAVDTFQKERGISDEDAEELRVLLKEAKGARERLLSSEERVGIVRNAGSSLLETLGEIQKRNGSVSNLELTEMLVATVALLESKKLIKIIE